MKIFIVDDNPLIIQLLTRLCESAGHTVTAVDDGYDALDIIITSIPDAAFIDLIMPRVSGDTLCRIIRRVPDCNGCRLVLMSGAASEVDIDLAAIGADLFLAKGATLTMVDNVRKVLSELAASAAPRGVVPPRTVGTENVVKRRITTELLARRRHLESVLDTVFNGVVELVGTNIVYANTAAAYLISRPMEKLLNTDFAQYFDPSERSRLNDLLSGAGDDGTATEALALRNRWVRIRRAGSSDGGAAQIVLIADVTATLQLDRERESARHQLEARVQQRRWQLERVNEKLEREADARRRSLARLEAEDSRFDHFMRFLPAAAFIKDEHGRYLYVNDAFCRSFGVDRERCMNRCDADLFDGIAAEQMERNDWAVRQRKSSLSSVEIIGRGEARTYYVTTRFLIFRKSGMPLLGGVAMDITTQKRLAEEQFEMQQQILRLRKMEAIGVLAGEMAHELNNMLSGLVSYPDYLLATSGDLPPGFQAKIERTQQAGERAVAVVTDVLHMAGGDMQKRVPLDLNAVLAGCLEEATAREAVPAHIHLQSLLAPEPVWVRGTEGLLCKAMRRLLDFSIALIGSAPGRVSLFVETVFLASGLNDFQVIPAGDHGVITVTDTGPPLSARDREQLFEPFFLKIRLGRVDSGLWMPVVWGIVRAHGGYVALGADETGGNRFRIFLPRIAPGADAST